MANHLVRLIALAFLGVAGLPVSTTAAEIPPIEKPVVRIAYLLPSDREANEAAIEQAATILRWYQLKVCRKQLDAVFRLHRERAEPMAVTLHLAAVPQLIPPQNFRGFRGHGRVGVAI